VINSFLKVTKYGNAWAMPPHYVHHAETSVVRLSENERTMKRTSPMKERRGPLTYNCVKELDQK
jgi:hypothetical protein